MKKKFFNPLFSFLLFALANQHLSINAQPNLVPNYSFEIDSLCPDGGSEINYAPPWHTAGGSPDYFNACAGSSLWTVGVPLNHAAYQYAKTGDAYAGIFCYFLNPPPVEYKEYLQVKLTDSLIVNRKYCISFYVNLTTSLGQAFGGAPYNNLAIKEMGMYISDTAVFRADQLTLPFVPQIKSPVGVFLDDTLNWTEISGEYIAHGGEKYITIGNFNNPTDTISIEYNNNYSVSYYFIDDVTLRDCTNDGVEEEANENGVSIFPNPARSELGITNYEVGMQEVKVKNVMGEVVISHWSLVNSKSASIDVSGLVKGMYFVEVYFDKLSNRGAVRKKFVKE